MKKYLIVIEETKTGFSAYSPDLPGCVSTGGNRPEVEKTCARRLRSISMVCVRKDSRLPNRIPIPPMSSFPREIALQ
jgi:hypothetical protein